jgi:hypothetical protein
LDQISLPVLARAFELLVHNLSGVQFPSLFT